MAAPDLTGRTISATYKDLLQVSNSNAGVDGSSRAVQDGEGTVSAMELSTAGLKSTGTLDVTGNTTLSGNLTLGTTTSVSAVKDEDDLGGGSSSSSSLATQQSIKAYVDDQVAGKDHLSELAGDSDDVSEGGTNRYVTTDQEDALAGTNGTPNSSNPFVTNTDSRLTDSRNPDGAAGGDLSGTYPNPTVAQLQGRDMASTAPSDGQVVAWNDSTSKWEPTTSSGSGTVTNIASGNGISGGPITGTGTLAVDIDGATDGTAITVADSTDEMLLWDATDSTVKKITVDQLPGASGGIASVAADSTPQLGGDLDVNSNSIVSASGSDGNIPIAPDGSGKVVLDGLSWPAADGDDGDVLKTDGAGNLSFSAESGGGGGGDTLPIADTTAVVKDPSDATKLVRIDAGAVGTGTTKVITMGDRDVNLANGGTFAENSHSHSYAAQGANSDITSLTGLTTALSVSQGGTGVATIATDSLITGNGTSAVTAEADLTYSAGALTIGYADTGSGELRILPDSDDSTKYSGFKCGTNDDDIVYTLPTTLGGAVDGDVLSIDSVTNKTLSWVTSGGGGGGMTSWDLDCDTGTTETVTDGAAVTIAGGTGITTVVSTTNTATVTLDLGGLTDDTGAGDTSGWTAGDFLAMVESGGAEKKIKPPAEIGIACSDETTALTTGDAKAVIMIPRAMTITEIKVSLTGADSSGTVDVQLRYDTSNGDSGTDVLDAPVSIAMGEYFAQVGGTDFTTDSSQICDENSFITVDIDSGSSLSDATGLKVWLLGYWT